MQRRSGECEHSGHVAVSLWQEEGVGAAEEVSSFSFVPVQFDGVLSLSGCRLSQFGRYVVFLVGLQAVTVLDGMLSPLSGCRLSQFWMVCCLLYRVAGCHSGGCCLLKPALPCAHAFCAASCLCCVPLCGAWLCDLFDFQNCGIGKTWTAQLGGHCTRNANLSLT